jgi:chorismate mutase / prephenate dehydratase
MTKLESRPVPGAPWEYMFYLDIEGHAEDERVRAGLEEMRRNARRLHVLGAYPSHAAGEIVEASAPPADPSAPDHTPAAPAQAPGRAPEPERPFRLASRAARGEDSVYRVGSAGIGKDFCLIAGPCAVESRDQVLRAAELVKQAGGQVLRGGVFKPRTSPYSFQGLGEEGLEYLCEAGERYGLPVITEVIRPEQVAAVAARVDILQIGARNMQNFALLREVGGCGRPVFLKRGMMSSIEEWLLAAEYILSQGNQQVILCERGLRGFDTATRNTLDLSAVPVVRSWSHLPVFVDPSHAVGVRDWIPDMAAAAVAAGAQGVMIEIHPEPENALCDRDQALGPDAFLKLARRLARLSETLRAD